MKNNSFLTLLILLIFLFLTNNGCDDSPTDNGDDLPDVPVISSLANTNAQPGSLLAIKGTDFGSAGNLSVRFSGNDNYEVDIPVIKATQTSINVFVPPYFNSADGLFESDTVDIRVIKKSGSHSVESNIIEDFIIEELPETASPPGTVTFNFLVWEISNYMNLQQEIEGTSMDIPSLNNAVSDNINNLQSLAANVYGIVQNFTTSFSLGSVNGVTIEIGAEELLQCDRFILGMFLTLGNTDIESPLSAPEVSSENNLSWLYAAPCPGDAFDQIEALQSSGGYTTNSHYDCVTSAAPDAVANAYYVVAGAGTVALGILALAGAPAIALALPAAAVIYATVMTSGMQITIGASLKNINNSAAVAAIHNGVDQIEDMCTGILTGMVLPGSSGAAKDIWDGIGMLSKAFTSTAPACSYTLSEYSKPFISAGGAGSFSVTAGPGCEWSAVSGSAWITVISGISGTGNGTVGYSVKPNTTSQQRTGSITVEDKSFTITQAGTSSQGGNFDGEWEGTFDGIHTYTSGSTYEYEDEPLSLSIDGTVITGGSPSLGSGTIDASGNGTWTGQLSPFIFTGTFTSDGYASGTWTCTIPGNGPQSGYGSGTWTATKIE